MHSLTQAEFPVFPLVVQKVVLVCTDPSGFAPRIAAEFANQILRYAQHDKNNQPRRTVKNEALLPM